MQRAMRLSWYGRKTCRRWCSVRCDGARAAKWAVGAEGPGGRALCVSEPPEVKPHRQQIWQHLSGNRYGNRYINTSSATDMGTPQRQQIWQLLSGDRYGNTSATKDTATPQRQQIWEYLSGNRYCNTLAATDVATPQRCNRYGNTSAATDMGTPQRQQIWEHLSGNRYSITSAATDMGTSPTDIATPQRQQIWEHQQNSQQRISQQHKQQESVSREQQIYRNTNKRLENRIVWIVKRFDIWYFIFRKDYTCSHVRKHMREEFINVH